MCQIRIEEVIGSDTIFALQDLTDMLTERLKQHEIQKTVNRMRFQERRREHFPNLTKEKDIRDLVFNIYLKAARMIISGATQAPHEKAPPLPMATLTDAMP